MTAVKSGLWLGPKVRPEQRIRSDRMWPNRGTAGTTPSLCHRLGSFFCRGLSLGDLDRKGHRVISLGILDHELVLAVIGRRDLHRTLWSGAVILADFLAGLV